MHEFEIDCRLAYEVMGPAHFLFHIEAANLPRQRVLTESLVVEPAQPMQRFADEPRGNRFFRLDPPVGPLSVSYRATVAVEPTPTPVQDEPEAMVRDLPAALLHMLSPTRYCESDLLGAAAMKLFAGIPPGRSRVETINRWIRDNVDYRVGSTTSTTTARDVFVQRSGVCRDFAHLGIAFCRALSIPARFVVGYVQFEEPPPDFHAIYEAWIGGRWIPFDATGLAPADQLVRVGTGGDAKDVAFATMYGPARMVSMSPEIVRVHRNAPPLSMPARAERLPA